VSVALRHVADNVVAAGGFALGLVAGRWLSAMLIDLPPILPCAAVVVSSATACFRGIGTWVQVKTTDEFLDSVVDAMQRRWDNPTMVVTLDTNRRLTVPTTLASARPGDCFEARFDAEEDAIVFRRLGGHESWFAVMKACPVSPDGVPPRRRELPRRRKL
jgi:hypothetical protein